MYNFNTFNLATNSSKNTILPLFTATKQHTTLTTILTRMYDVMQ